MADTKISALSAATALAGTEEIPGVQSAANVKITPAQIKTFASASPTLVTPALGTPSSGVLTNCTGTAAGLTAGNVTTNANLTGHVTSTGNAAVLGSFTAAQLNAAISDADMVTTGANIFTAAQEVNLAVDATSTDGFGLETTTDATVGAQKYSPRIRWKGFGWKTNATAASQSVEFIAEVQPVQGAAAPTANLVFGYAVNGGAFGSAFTLTSAGAALSGTDGSASSVSFGRASSVNTGVYFPGGNQVAMASNGTQVFQAASTGCQLLGITQVGTSSDTGFARNAAGVVEINSCSAGTLRDIKFRNTIGQTGYTEMVEMTAPAAGASNTGRLFLQDNGAGKTQLMIQFATGAAQQVAIEP